MNMKNFLVRAEAIKMSGTSNITFKNACKRLGIEPIVKDENGKEKFYFKKSDVERIKNITNPVIILQNFYREDRCYEKRTDSRTK